MIDVLFFGPVAERMGTGKISVEHREGMRLEELQANLRTRHPEAFAMVSLAALNGTRVSDPSITLADRCEVVFMSRFSGG